jgi:hypothetical protein
MASIIFQFEHAFFGDFAKSLPSGRPIIYDAHNVEFDDVRSECSLSTIRDLVGKRIYRLERDLVERASSVLVCSSNERHRFADLYGTRDDQMVVAPNGIKRIQQVSSPNATAALHERFPDLPRFQQYGVYTGSDVEHNRQAVRLIIERIAPQLRDECAFVIHGTVAKVFMNKKLRQHLL